MPSRKTILGRQKKHLSHTPKQQQGLWTYPDIRQLKAVQTTNCHRFGIEGTRLLFDTTKLW